MSVSKSSRRIKIKKRSRSIVRGTADRPRLCVFKSNNEIYAQLINDETGKTLLSVSSKIKIHNFSGTKTEVASAVGKLVAEKSLDLGIKAVRFDRNGFLFHGRILALAQSAREVGLLF